MATSGPSSDRRPRSSARPPPRTRRPPIPASWKRDISFLHPGYKEPFNVLFKLPQIDQVPAPAAAAADPSPAPTHYSQRYGVHHATALAACQIVANNAFNGFLSHDPEGKQPVGGSTTILRMKKYYFVVPDSTAAADGSNDRKEPYAIVPRFEDWPFPHGRIPRLWQSTPSTQGHGMDRCRGGTSVLPTCAVSGADWTADKCHIIPEDQESWYHKNGMANYRSTGGLGIDDPANMCILRTDIHAAFDASIFAVVPKPGGFGYFAVQALQFRDPWTRFIAEFHEKPFYSTAKNEYLFARFAAAVFMLIGDFVTNVEVSRRVARRVECVDEGPATSFETKIEWMTGRELSNVYAKGRSEGEKPRKRARGDGDDPQEDEEEEVRTRKRHRNSI
ncbi:hypothetical protein F5Y10DRAFT_256440 [Nemania abortiva]|nr:hypothetical protein F5Y10DRAFT_256440 [Nemania abortiva]